MAMKRRETISCNHCGASVVCKVKRLSWAPMKYLELPEDWVQGDTGYLCPSCDRAIAKAEGNNENAT